MNAISDISYRRDEVTADKITEAWSTFDAALDAAGVAGTEVVDVILSEIVHRMWSGESRGELKAVITAKAEEWVDRMFDSIGDCEV